MAAEAAFMFTINMEDKTILKELLYIKKYILIGAKEVLNIEEAMIFIGLSRSRIHNLTSAKEIPHFKREGGRDLYFKKKELEEWMTSKRIPTNEEMESAAVLHTRKKKIM